MVHQYQPLLKNFKTKTGCSRAKYRLLANSTQIKSHLPTKNSNCDKFEIEEKEHLVKKCPYGHKPVSLKKDPIAHILIRNTASIAPSVKIVR